MVTGEHLIMSRTWEENGLWWGRWLVGTRGGTADFDTKEEAEDYCKRNSNREVWG